MWLLLPNHQNHSAPEMKVSMVNWAAQPADGWILRFAPVKCCFSSSTTSPWKTHMEHRRQRHNQHETILLVCPYRTPCRRWRRGQEPTTTEQPTGARARERREQHTTTQKRHECWNLVQERWVSVVVAAAAVAVAVVVVVVSHASQGHVMFRSRCIVLRGVTHRPRSRTT
jgi:hypothetical protein